MRTPKPEVPPVQLELGLPEPPERAVRGGRRVGAGRKRAVGVRESVPHRSRPVHKGRHPVHVTLRALPGLPSLRTRQVSGMLRSVLLDQRKRRYEGSFQVVEFSIQDNHLHLIVEATGEDAQAVLRAGVTGLMVAFAKRLNMMLGRRGKVWGDRWHGQELPSPREVRNRLVYVFRNVAHHGTRVLGSGVVDPLSSAWRFDGWTRPVVSYPEMGAWPAAPPRTWLLEKGWKIHGLIDTSETSRGETGRPSVHARPAVGRRDSQH